MSRLLLTEVAMDLDPIPGNVKQKILEIANSVRLLKTCRLVSKSWNQVSCGTMQNLAAVSLKVSPEELDSLEELKDILLDRQAYFPPDWPNPFQNYKVLQASFSNLNFVRFIQRPNLRVTTLDITHDEHFDPLSFENILETHSAWITHIQIRSKVVDSPAFPTLGRTLEKGWPSLKKITLSDTCPAGSKPCSHMEFVIALTANKSLQQLRLKGHLQNITSVFSQNRESWDELVQLNLSSEKPPAEATPEAIHGFMKWAQEIKFPSLKDLKVWFNLDSRSENLTLEKYTPYILPLIQDSCQALKSLRVTFVPMALLPSCPNISHLTCAFANGDRIQDVSELKFPSLSSLHSVLYWKEAPGYEDPGSVPANGRVASFAVSRSEYTATGAIETLWPSLRDHFPNLRVIRILPSMPGGTLNALRRCVPQLQDLEINRLSGTELLATDAEPLLASKGWASRDISNCPLFEMTELTHLRLGKWINLTRDALILLLGKLNKLKFLSFYWKSTFHVMDVQEHLRHIPQVNIIYEDKEQKQKLEQLSKTMKSVKLVKHQ